MGRIARSVATPPAGPPCFVPAFRRGVTGALLALGVACRGDVAPDVPVPARAVITPASATIAGLGRTTEVQVAVTDSRGRVVERPVVTWRSSSPAVALVSGDGATAIVTAVAPGSALISAQTVGGSATASTDITVSAEVRSVTFPDTSATLDLRDRKTQRITAQATADDGVVVSYRWSVSSPQVVALSADTGASVTVTAVAVGTAMLTVRTRSQFSNEERTATLRVNVKGTVYHLAVDQRGARLVPGQTAVLKTSVVADDGADTRAAWSSRDVAVATVSPDGMVTAVGPGSTYVLATSLTTPERRDSASITVTTSPVVQAATSWETVLAPPMPGAGGRWFTNTFDVAYTPGGDLVVLGDCGVYLRGGTQFARVQLNEPWCFTRAASFGPHMVVLTFRGDVYRWNGSGGFSRPLQGPFPGQFAIVDVWVAPTGEVIVAGNHESSGGAVYALRSGQWVEVATTPGIPIRSAAGADASEFLVSASSGELLRFTGNRWRSVGSLPTGGTGASLWSPGGGDYYIAAGNAGAWRLTNDALTRLGGTPVSLVRGTSASDVVFVRPCGLDRWNGSVMQDTYVGIGLGNYCYTPTLLAVSGSELTHAIGSIVAAHPRTTAGVGPVVRLAINPELRAVAATGLNHAIAVGEWGYVAHWNGAMWRSEAAPGHRTLYGVSSLGPTQTWAAGDGVFFHDGATWQMVDTHTRLMRIWATDARNVWAVGLGGVVLRFDGSSWSEVSVGTTAHLRAVWGTDASSMYIGGDGGLLLRFDGRSFTRIDTGSEEDIYSIHGSGNELWVGGVGNIRRFDGVKWSTVTGFSQPVSYALWFSSPFDAYAAGGCVHRFEGGTFWRLLACTLTYDVTGFPSGGVVAVGGGGSLWLGRNQNGGFGNAGTTPARFTDVGALRGAVPFGSPTTALPVKRLLR